MDLNKLYEKQAKLDKHILDKHNIKMSKEELLDNTILALLVEVGELANTTRCFKRWSTKGMMDKEIVIDELADVWHFYLSIGNQTTSRFNYELSRHMVNNFQRKLDITDIRKEFLNLYIGITNEGWIGIGLHLINIADILGFTDKEVEQAYLKKHEENYKRKREGY